VNARRRKKKVRISPWAWIVVPAVFVTVFAAGMYLGLHRQEAQPSTGSETAAATVRAVAPQAPPPLVLERPEAAPPTDTADAVTDSLPGPATEVPAASTATTTVGAANPVARVALVIDDLGRSLGELDAIRALGIPITYSVLPFEVRTPQVVAQLQLDGVEFLCHMPMEPGNGANPGPGALTSSMSRRQLRRAARAALDAVPGAVGVNNHMGSELTTDPRAMETVLKLLAKRHIFFLDSRTSADTLGYQVARSLGVPATERQVFLDGDLAPLAIADEFERLLQIARLNGSAVGIGHPHAVTLEVLAEQIPLARAQGFEFVAVSLLVDRDHPMAQ